MGDYRTIVADPPWMYGGFATAPTIKRRATAVKVAACPYPTMTVAEICAIRVGDVAATDARLFLWTTNRYLPNSFAVLDAWGFQYRQVLTWRKTGNPSPFGGSVAPNHAEFLLVAAKGSPPVSARLKSSVIEAPAAAPGKAPGGRRSHSSKPDVFLDVIEQVSPGPYLELFARRPRIGWDQAGDQSAGTVHVLGLRAPEDVAA